MFSAQGKAVRGVLWVVVVITVAYAACFLLYEANATGKSAETASELASLRNSLQGYYAHNGRWPSTLRYYYREERDVIPVDSFSREPYLYTPDSLKPTDEAIIVAQPQPFKTRLWPFGQLRRYVLLANGKVRMFQGDEARLLERN